MYVDLKTRSFFNCPSFWHLRWFFWVEFVRNSIIEDVSHFRKIFFSLFFFSSFMNTTNQFFIAKTRFLFSVFWHSGMSLISISLTWFFISIFYSLLNIVFHLMALQSGNYWQHLKCGKFDSLFLFINEFFMTRFEIIIEFLWFDEENLFHISSLLLTIWLKRTHTTSKLLLDIFRRLIIKDPYEY